MCADRAMTPGREPLAEIGRLLGLMSRADLREMQLRDLRADAQESTAEVYATLSLMVSGRLPHCPEVLRSLADQMRRAAGSLGLLLDMQARG